MTPPDTLFEIVEPDDEVYADYGSRFEQYNRDAAGLEVHTYSLILREGDHIVAGGRGHVYLGAVEIRGLWIDAVLRGRGVGSDLLRALEREAVRRGASRAMLYTYSWQAEAFYKKHDYQEFGRFEFPAGHARIDLQKEL